MVKRVIATLKKEERGMSKLFTSKLALIFWCQGLILNHGSKLNCPEPNAKFGPNFTKIIESNPWSSSQFKKLLFLLNGFKLLQ